MDRLVELVEFTGRSSSVVCVTFYRRCAQRVSFEAQNIMDIIKVIILFLNKYYR